MVRYCSPKCGSRRSRIRFLSLCPNSGQPYFESAEMNARQLSFVALVLGLIWFAPHRMGLFDNNLGAIALSKGVLSGAQLAPETLEERLLRLNQAETYFHQALSREPEQARFVHNLLQVHLQRAALFSRAGDWDNAILSYQIALTVDANSFDAYLKLGEILTYQKPKEAQFLEPAIAYLKQAEAVVPSSGYARLVLGHALWFSGRQHEAIATVEEAVTLEPSAYYWTVLCAFYQGEQRWPNAVIACNSALALDAKRVDAWLNLGDAYAGQGDRVQALQAWRKVMEIAPGSEWAQYARVRMDALK